MGYDLCGNVIWCNVYIYIDACFRINVICHVYLLNLVHASACFSLSRHYIFSILISTVSYLLKILQKRFSLVEITKFWRKKRVSGVSVCVNSEFGAENLSS